MPPAVEVESQPLDRQGSPYTQFFYVGGESAENIFNCVASKSSWCVFFCFNLQYSAISAQSVPHVSKYLWGCVAGSHFTEI